MSLKRKGKKEDQPPRRRQGSGGDQAAEKLGNFNYSPTFRRNRTITGSSSAKIASSNELRADLVSPRAHVHHLALTRRRLLLYLVVTVAGIFALYVLVSQLVASVNVRVVGAAPFTSQQMQPYRAAVEAYYAARPVERLRFLLNEGDFLKNLQAMNPDVEFVHVDQGSKLGEALLTITPREPIARWKTGGKREYVDASGVVFAKNYFTDPKVEIRDNSGLQTAGTQVVTSHRFLAFVGRVIGYAAHEGYTVKTVTIPALTTRQVRITLQGVGQYYTFSVDRPPAEQVEDMIRITSYLKTHGIAARYVDVRVEGKAFYK
jgi:hypothetical protein